MKFAKKCARVVLKFVVLPCISICLLAASGTLAYIHWYHADFHPGDVDTFLNYQPPLLTEILDESGKRLVELPGLETGSSIPHYRRWIAFEDIPEVMVQATLAAEDKRFFSHGGIDQIAISRAVWEVFWASCVASFENSSFEFVPAEGASTVTQQAVRQVSLREMFDREQKGIATNEEKVIRKLKEMRMAIWLEDQLAMRLGSKEKAKEKIFEIFANASYEGHGRYGFAAASEFLFGRKELREVSLPEAAMLAGMIRNPSKYSPYVNLKNGYDRRNYIIYLMGEAGFVPAEEVVNLQSEPIILHETPSEKTIAPAVVSYVLKDLWGKKTNSISWENGSRVKTTIRRSWQIVANEALEYGLKEYLTRHPEYSEKIQGAVVVLTNDGKIRALVGGARSNYASFNRATEAKRQPGSVFKSFVYATAWEHDYRLSCRDPGTGPCKGLDSPVSIRMGRGRPRHGVSNYDGRFYGSTELWKCIAESRNACTVRLSMALGSEAVVELAQRLGLSQSVEAYPTTAIGAEEVTPLELTAAYMVFANGGVRIEPRLIESVEHARGEEVVFPVSEPYRVLDERVALEMQKALRHTVVWRSGTAKKLQELPFAVAGKTGTTNAFRDAWFCGFTPGPDGFTMCVWIGMDDGTPLGDGELCKPLHPVDRQYCEPGGKVALPVFMYFARVIYSSETPPQFPVEVEEAVRLAEEPIMIIRKD